MQRYDFDVILDEKGTFSASENSGRILSEGTGISQTTLFNKVVLEKILLKRRRNNSGRT